VKANPFRYVHRLLYSGGLYRDTCDVVQGIYRGRPYASLDAILAAQRTAPESYELNDEHLNRAVFDAEIAATPDAWQYPAIYHIGKAMRAGAVSVVDFGGSAGQHFYQFRRYLDFNNLQSWTVCDLPKITAFGTQIAAGRGEALLRFSTDLAAAARDCDILYSSGALQYTGNRLFETLQSAPARPRFVILNKIEITDGAPTFHCLMNHPRATYVASTYAPADFRDRMECLGYRCADQWAIGDARSRAVFSNTPILHAGFLFAQGSATP
jgi:putative methyltransferase (TIGR04325 family)